MKKSLSNMVFVLLLATPFMALGSLVHAVAPLHNQLTQGSLPHPIVHSEYQAVRVMGKTAAHLESAGWLQLHPDKLKVRTWSL
jgi:hypothetical protein